MQTFRSSETVLFSSSSTPGDDDVDIDFGDVFGGPPKRRSKVTTRHSFNETPLRRGDVIGGALILPDEKPVFGEDPSLRRRFTSDDFFDDIFRASNEMTKTNESSLPGSRILSPTQPIHHKPTEIPTFGSSPTRSSSEKKDSSSSKGRQFHFSIYKWPNKGVPVIIWGSSRLSSMSKPEERADEEGEGESSLEQPCVETEEDKTMSEKKPFSVEANVKPLHSFLDDKDNRQGEDTVLEREVRKEDSRNEKKPLGKRSSFDSPTPDKPSSSSVPEVVKDGGGKGKVMDFVKRFSQGDTVGAGGESLGKSSRWRAKDTPKTNINHETVNIPDQQQKKPTSDIPDMGTQKKDSDRERLNTKKASSGVFEQEKRRVYNTSEDIDEPFHVNFEVEEITQDDETKNDTKEIENIDAKIRKWSSGKSGNIRSLLSTLQYILWAGSGWKAVPLMDMIEGNAVRKSYQRALLILHPDKLQQKGASANQKYTAEKVFELLQEAWDHFNSLGPV